MRPRLVENAITGVLATFSRVVATRTGAVQPTTEEHRLVSGAASRKQAKPVHWGGWTSRVGDDRRASTATRATG